MNDKVIPKHIQRRDRIAEKRAVMYENAREQQTQNQERIANESIAAEAISSASSPTRNKARKRRKEREEAAKRQAAFVKESVLEKVIDLVFEASILDDDYMANNAMEVRQVIENYFETMISENKIDIAKAVESPNELFKPFADFLQVQEADADEVDEMDASDKKVIDSVNSQVKEMLKAEIDAGKRNETTRQAIEESTESLQRPVVRKAATEGTLIRAFMSNHMRAQPASESASEEERAMRYEQSLGQACLESTLFCVMESLGILNWNSTDKNDFIKRSIRGL